MWRRLSHENILSFRGVNMTLFQLALVYDWGQNGNITQYLASNPGASRLSLVRNLLPQKLRPITNAVFLARQLFGVAKGLLYLHSVNIPHGDLKEVGCFPRTRLQLPHLQR